MSKEEDGIKEEQKTTSEKPISLKPLTFKEALVNLLAIKPKKNKKVDEKKEPDQK